VIVSHHARPASPSRCCDENLATLNLAESSPYKCPLPQPLSFHILPNARGVWGPAPPFPDVLTFRHCDVQTSAPAPIFPVSPLAATLMDSPVTVANKRLTEELTPLDATLTKNTGVGPHLSCRPLNVPTFKRSNDPLSDSLPVPTTCIRRTIGAIGSIGQTVYGSPFLKFILCGRV